jgi:hypothetical protein
MKPDLIQQLFDIANNQEFTEGQRKDMMAVAIDEQEQITGDIHPASLMIDAAISKHMTKESAANGGIRFGLNPAHPPT